MLQLITVIAGAFNLALCLTQLYQALKIVSFTFLIWLFASIFAVMVMIEGAIAPVYLAMGQRAFQIDPPTVAKACLFMLVFNLLMAIASYYVRRALGLSALHRRIFYGNAYPKELKQLILPLTIIFTVALIIYLRRIGGYANFADRYRDGGSAWEMVIMVACWSAVSLCLVFRRTSVLLYLISLGILLTYASGVRYFALFFIVPVVVFYFMKGVADSRLATKRALSAARKYIALSLIACVAFTAFAQFVLANRSDSISSDTGGTLKDHHWPELWLLKGFYVIIDAYDNGYETFGFTSYHRMLAGVLFPYLSVVDRNYSYELDPPVMFAHIVGNYDLNDTQHFQHWPLLLYADAYAGFRVWGCLLGLLWGCLYALVDYVLSKPPAFPFLFPFAMWFYYMTFRGAVSNSIVSIPREFYINIVLMSACHFFYWVRGQRVAGLSLSDGILPVGLAKRMPGFSSQVR